MKTRLLAVGYLFTALAIWAAPTLVVAGSLLGGCAPAKNPAQARADARAVISLVEDAWMVTAQTCVNVASASLDQKLLDDCRSVMEPARDQLLVAASAVDGWSDADQKNLPCLVRDALDAVAQEEAALKAMGVKIPQTVDDAFIAARNLVGACVPEVTK